MQKIGKITEVSWGEGAESLGHPIGGEHFLQKHSQYSSTYQLLDAPQGPPHNTFI